ncbi:hypothetical protein EV193_110108 [Herbihabitans rhizosphaerae]|uniref:NAD(P)-binding domain-containing protein n=1 Tax=Herbihabitans rhizosphaerae TaxID=1872711 RepID=A0A4Q7KGI1_9PSEU|nr:NAD(P)H-binding protein [Herbihabitans rhizosphaerae]RZS33958.1 hypothetical protein EV193_110108 [Herbihabitans rhizosphaerae]
MTAVVRKPLHPNEVRGDASTVDDVARLTGDHDAAISATRPPDGSEHELVETAKALLAGVARSGTRLLLVGGAATLRAPGGGLVLDDRRYLPEVAADIARACAEQHAVLRESTVDWTYLSPPANLVPGERTGVYRLGSDELVVDANGESTISIEDLAVVLLDEIEHPKHRRTRFTAAY